MARDRSGAQPEPSARSGLHAPVSDRQDRTPRAYDAKADADFARGSDAGDRSDKYIRDTVFLATVLFLVGIAGHFAVRQARLGLIAVAGVMLLFSVVQLRELPGTPGGI